MPLDCTCKSGEYPQLHTWNSLPLSQICWWKSEEVDRLWLQCCVTWWTRYVVTRCFHVAFTLLSRCFRVAFTLLSRCFHVAFTLLSRCFHVAFTLLSRCFHVAFTLLSRCFHVAFTLLSRCFHVALFPEVCLYHPFCASVEFPAIQQLGLWP